MTAGRWRLCWIGLASALAAAFGCAEGPGETPTPTSAGPLPPGVVARVADLDISGHAVLRIAAAQGIERTEARDRAVFDALCAAAARAGPQGSSRSVRNATSRVFAQALHERLWQQAQAAPVSPEDLERWTAHRWLDVDRPTGYRTVHAVVRSAEDADDDTKQRARALAHKLLEATSPVVELCRREPAPERDGKARFRFSPRAAFADSAVLAFMNAMKEVDAGDLEVVVQPLPVVAADGRVLDYSISPDQTYAAEFAGAAAALTERGAVSDVVSSPFGFHVILLLEIVPGRQPPERARNAELRPQIHEHRAQEARTELLDKLRAQTATSLASNVDALLEQVVIEQ